QHCRSERRRGLPVKGRKTTRVLRSTSSPNVRSSGAVARGSLAAAGLDRDGGSRCTWLGKQASAQIDVSDFSAKYTTLTQSGNTCRAQMCKPFVATRVKYFQSFLIRESPRNSPRRF